MFNFTFNSLNNDYFLSLILFNIIVYIVMVVNIFLIFFIFDMQYIKTLNELKNFNNLPLVTVYVVLLFLSFAGTPPLIGFLSKFLMFIFLFSKQNLFLFFIFILINFFSMYFYIQNLRFLISKKISNKFLIKNNQICLNHNLLYYINWFNFFNLFSILYFEELFIFLNFLSSNITF